MNQSESSNEIILDAIYIKRTLIYVTDLKGTDFVTEKHFLEYLQLRTTTPKLCRTFETRRELIACINAL